MAKKTIPKSQDPDLDVTTRSWAVRFESLSKIVLAFVGASYVIGILVVNLCYGQYGYYSLSLFRINYAASGLWSLSFLFLSYFLWEMWFENILCIFRTSEKRFDRIIAGIGIVLGPLSIWVIAIGLSEILHIQGNWAWLGSSFLAFISLASAGKETVKIIRSRLIRKVRIGESFEILFTILLLTAYFGAFSKNIFPLIPANIGGGMPHHARIIVETKSEKALSSFGIPFELQSSDSSDTSIPSGFTLSLPIRVLTVTEDDIIILHPKEKGASIVVRKQFIVAVKNLIEDYQ